MPKPYYADYVNHILRFYFRYTRTKGFKNEVDKLNYNAADKIIQRMSASDREALSLIFNQDSTHLTEIVAAAAEQRGEEQSKLWTLIANTTSKIAKERRLL